MLVVWAGVTLICEKFWVYGCNHRLNLVIFRFAIYYVHV